VTIAKTKNKAEKKKVETRELLKRYFIIHINSEADPD